MAKVITLNECPAPTNPTATAVSGGVLTAGTTYYYRVVAIGPGDRYNAGNIAMFWCSIPCAEVTATTDAVNKSIELYWDNPVDSNGYDGEVFLIFKTEISGDYDAYKSGTFYSHLLLAGSSARAYGLTKSQCVASGSGYKYTDDGSKSLGRCPLLPDGCPCWEVEGGSDSDPITPEDLYNWAVTNSKTYCIDSWNMYPGMDSVIAVRTMASIRQPQPGTQPLYFGIPNRTYFLQQWGKTWFDSDSYFRTGEIENGKGKYGGTWQRGGGYAWYSGSYGTVEIYEGSIISLPKELPYTNLTRGKSGHLFQMVDDCNFTMYRSLYDPIGAGSSSGRVKPAVLDLQSNKMHILAAELAATDVNIEDCEIENFIISGYNIRQGKIANSTFLNPTQYDFRGYNRSATEDQVTILENVTFANSTPDIRGSVVTTAEVAHQVVLEQYTMDLKIDNTILQDAVVKVKDINGYNAIWLNSNETLSEAISIGETDWTVSDGSVFSTGDSIRVNREVLTVTNVTGDVLTVTRGQENTEDRQYATGQQIFIRHDSLTADVNGVFTTIPLVRRTYWLDPTFHGATGYYVMENIRDNSPHTLTIQKKGLQIYSKAFTVTKKIDWEINLTRNKINLDQGVV